MSNKLTNEDIVKKFLASKALDFGALGKFISENGEAIATSEDSGFGIVMYPRFSIHYCIPPVTRPAEIIDAVAAGARSAVTGD